MTKSDSLDNITLDSDEIRTIERFETNYHNHKKNKLQNGGMLLGNNKLVRNIERLYNCYVLLQNQNGGNNNDLTIIKKKLHNKIAELNNYNK
jgi:hypothetical protein